MSVIHCAIVGGHSRRSRRTDWGQRRAIGGRAEQRVSWETGASSLWHCPVTALSLPCHCYVRLCHLDPTHLTVRPTALPCRLSYCHACPSCPLHRLSHLLPTPCCALRCRAVAPCRPRRGRGGHGHRCRRQSASTLSLRPCTWRTAPCACSCGTRRGRSASARSSPRTSAIRMWQ
jgi:hypothetical protein